MAVILTVALLAAATSLPSASASGPASASAKSKAKGKAKRKCKTGKKCKAKKRCKAKKKRSASAAKKKQKKLKSCKKRKKKPQFLRDGLVMEPENLEFGSQTVGLASASKSLTVTNTGNYGSGHLLLAYGGPHQSDFPILSETCSAAQLPPGGTCTITLRFVPLALGSRSTTLSVIGTQGGTDVSLLRGTGTV